MKLESNIPKKQIFDIFTKHFSIQGWDVKVTSIIASAEDGKNYNITVMILLIIMGFLTLLLFFIGILFWIFAAAYYIASDKHRVKLIHLKDNIYETYTNSSLANKLMNNFISTLEKENKISLIKPKPKKPTLEEMYKKLLEVYSATWSSGLAQKRLEKL